MTHQVHVGTDEDGVHIWCEHPAGLDFFLGEGVAELTAWLHEHYEEES